MVARIYPNLSDNIKPQYSTVGSDTCNALTFNTCFDSAGGRVDHLHQLEVLNALYQTRLVEATSFAYEVIPAGDDINLYSLHATDNYAANKVLLGSWIDLSNYPTIATSWASSIQGSKGNFVAGSNYYADTGFWSSTALLRPATSTASRRVAYWDGTQYVVAANTSGQPLVQLSASGTSTWTAGTQSNAQPINGTSLNSIVFVPDLWIGNTSLPDTGVGVTYLAGSPGFVCVIRGSTITHYPHGIAGNVGASAITYDYRAGEFLFAGRTTNKLYYASDPTAGSWTTVTVTGVTMITDVLAVGGVWIIIGAASDLGAGTVLISVDHGTSWQKLGLTSIDKMTLVDRRIAFISRTAGIYLSGVVGVK